MEIKNEKKKKLMQEPFLGYCPNYSEKKNRIARRQLYRDLSPWGVQWVEIVLQCWGLE